MSTHPEFHGRASSAVAASRCGRRSRSQRFFTPTESHRHLGLYCLGVGWQDGLATPVPGRVLTTYAAVHIRDGSGVLTIGRGEAQHLVGPALFWLTPGVTHSYRADPGGWQEDWVLFDGFGVRGYEALGYITRVQTYSRLESAQTVGTAFDQLIERCRITDIHTDVDAAMLTHEVIIAGARASRAEPGHDHLSQLVEELRSYAHQPLNIDQIARKLGVSVAHLREATRTRTGSTPKEVILETRLSRAKVLLADTSFLVAHIGREVGYDDPAYFSRMFTHHVGVSPATFRRTVARVPRTDSPSTPPQKS